jgi:hypothetical protein
MVATKLIVPLKAGYTDFSGYKAKNGADPCSRKPIKELPNAKADHKFR